MRIAPLVLLHPAGAECRALAGHGARLDRHPSGREFSRLVRRICRPAGTSAARCRCRHSRAGSSPRSSQPCAGSARTSCTVPAVDGSPTGKATTRTTSNTCSAKPRNMAGAPAKPATRGTRVRTCSRPCRACSGSSRSMRTIRRKRSSGPVNDTKDNDTVAAIVGAAVGALHGGKLARAMADGVARPDDRGRQRARVPADRSGNPAGLDVAPGHRRSQSIRWRRPAGGVSAACPS